MIAFATAWGVFWLILWLALLAMCLIPPMDKDSKKFGVLAVVGLVVSFAWLVAVGVAAVLS